LQGRKSRYMERNKGKGIGQGQEGDGLQKHGLKGGNLQHKKKDRLSRPIETNLPIWERED